MAALARVRLHEEFTRNLVSTFHLGRAREKCALRAISFIVHVGGRHRRIFDKGTRLPRVADIPCPTAQACKYREAHNASDQGRAQSSPHPAAIPESLGAKQC